MHGNVFRKIKFQLDDMDGVTRVSTLLNILIFLSQGKRALDFIDKHTGGLVRDPLFLMLSTPACHAPFTPAPQYNNSFSNVTVPRNGSFNKYNPVRSTATS